MNPSDNQLTIGLDLGDRRHTVCVFNAGGDIVTEEVITNTRECLEALATRFTTPAARAAVRRLPPGGCPSTLDSSLHQRGQLTPPPRVRMEACTDGNAPSPKPAAEKVNLFPQNSRHAFSWKWPEPMSVLRTAMAHH